MERALLPGNMARRPAPQIIVSIGQWEHKILWKLPQKRLYLSPLFDYNIGVHMEARFSDGPILLNLLFSMR